MGLQQKEIQEKNIKDLQTLTQNEGGSVSNYGQIVTQEGLNTVESDFQQLIKQKSQVKEEKKEVRRNSKDAKAITELSSKNIKPATPTPAPVEPVQASAPSKESGRQKKVTTKNAFQADTEENENSVDESYYDNSIDNDMDSDGQETINIKQGEISLTFQSMSEPLKTQLIQQLIKYVSGWLKKFKNMDQQLFENRMISQAETKAKQNVLTIFNQLKQKFSNVFHDNIKLSIFCDLILDFMVSCSEKFMKNPSTLI